MSGQKVRIICDRARAGAPMQTGDLHDDASYHRYYKSTATNGGERVAETRRGRLPRPLNVCGF